VITSRLRKSNFEVRLNIADAAQIESTKLISSKTKKGYVEISGMPRVRLTGSFSFLRPRL
jgi:predicted DNA-binding WGR domain protein